MNIRKKNKLIALLKRLGDTSHSEGAVLDQLSNEIENLKSQIPKPTNLSPFYANIDELRGKQSSLSQALNNISNKVGDQNKSVMEMISTLNSSYTKLIEEQLRINEALLKEIADLKIRIRRQGGGSIPLRVSLNGVVANVKYSDINIVNVGGTSANNETTKNTDITIVGGSAPTESDLLLQDGTNVLLQDGTNILLNA